MIRYMSVLLLVILGSCSGYSDPPYIQIVDNITKDFIRNAKKNANVRLEGTGGRLFMGVEAIWVGFASDQSYSVDEARRQFMVLATDLVKRIKANNSLRPYLKNPEHIERVAAISLSYTNRIPNPDVIRPVAFVTLVNGKIFYSANSNNHPGFDDLHSETYFEALEILNNLNNRIN